MTETTSMITLQSIVLDMQLKAIQLPNGRVKNEFTHLIEDYQVSVGIIISFFVERQFDAASLGAQEIAGVIQCYYKDTKFWDEMLLGRLHDELLSFADECSNRLVCVQHD